MSQNKDLEERVTQRIQANQNASILFQQRIN